MTEDKKKCCGREDCCGNPKHEHEEGMSDDTVDVIAALILISVFTVSVVYYLLGLNW